MEPVRYYEGPLFSKFAWVSIRVRVRVMDWNLQTVDLRNSGPESIKLANCQLPGTSWGASTSTLHTTALALCYSVTEYCCPVWARTSYTNLNDTQLHSGMSLISGCLQPTQLSWLPVLSNVAPPSLHCKAQMTICLKSSKPIQTGLCTLMSLNIHLHGLHLDTQYGQT